MSYLKGEDTLPPELLAEIQKYVQGALVYIPRPPQERMPWGHKNGTRVQLDQRDEAIREAKASGKTINELADEYALSSDAIRKILYRKKPTLGVCAELLQSKQDICADIHAVRPGAA